MINNIVSYKNQFFYINKLYKSFGKFDGMISITSLENENISIRLSISSVSFISN